MSLPEITKEFTDFYYNAFVSNRATLAPLYRAGSMLTFNGTQVLGREAICEKYTSLPFSRVQHTLTNVNAQPSIHQGAILVNVTGFLKVDDDANPLNFSQAFQLVPESGTYYVHNDIFSINVV